MYYEWSLGLLALAFTPFILIATFLQKKVMAEENMGTAKIMEKCTKVKFRMDFWDKREDGCNLYILSKSFFFGDHR